MERPLFLLAYVQEMCRQCAGMLKLQHTRSSAAYDTRFHPPRSKCTSFLCFKRRASESTRCPRFGGKPPFFFFFFLCQTTCFRFTSGLRVQRLADVLVMAGGLHHPCVCVCVFTSGLSEAATVSGWRDFRLHPYAHMSLFLGFEVGGLGFFFH